MKARWLILLQCSFLVILFGPRPLRGAANALNNVDIANMVKAGIDVRTIVYDIEVNTEDEHFDVSPKGLEDLKEKDHVPGAVLRAMIAAAQKKGTSPHPNYGGGKKNAGQTSSAPRFSGSTVLAKYVAGTEDNNGALGKLGCLKWSSGDSSALIFSKYNDNIPFHKPAGFVMHLVEPAWFKGGRLCKDAQNGSSSTNVDIPFDEIKLLASGRVQAIGQPGTGEMQSLLTLAGVGGLVSSLASSSTAATTKIWLGVGAGTVALVGAGVYLNRRTNNYITIFYKDRTGEKKSSAGPEPKLITQSRVTTQKAECKYNCEQTGRKGLFTVSKTTVTTKVPPPEKSPGKCADGCEVAVFQIIDPHDWWNTIMFLEARTGQPVISETSIFSTAGGSSTPAKK